MEKSGINVEVVRYSFNSNLQKNVFGTIPATTETDEYILLGAHFDSVEGSPGASDNATGVALVLATIEKILQLEIRNKNVMLVFFNNEEQGLIGSRIFTRYLEYEEINVQSAITVDMIGWDSDGDRAIELEKPTEDLYQIFKEVAEEHNVEVFTSESINSDHQAFREAGIPAIGISEEWINNDTTPHYHKESDTFETINFEYLRLTTQVVFEALKKMLQN